MFKASGRAQSTCVASLVGPDAKVKLFIPWCLENRGKSQQKLYLRPVTDKAIVMSGLIFFSLVLKAQGIGVLIANYCQKCFFQVKGRLTDKPSPV